MSPNLGNMSGRQRLGGTSTSPSAYGAERSADLTPLPSGSITRPPLKSADIRRGALDLINFISALVFIAVTGLALAAGFFLLFVQS